MTHRASLERMLKAGSGRWVELDGHVYATNGFTAALVDDPALVAWLQAAYETKPELAGLARVITDAKAIQADPTDILTDGNGQLARLFKVRDMPTVVAIDTRWLTPYNGKHTRIALAGLDWWYGKNAVSGWAGDVCQVIAMQIDYGTDGPLAGLPFEAVGP